MGMNSSSVARYTRCNALCQSPFRTKGVIVNDRATKAIGLGAMLLLVNVIVGVTGVVDGLIESGVQDNVQSSMVGEEDFGEDWLNSTGERVYFAYNIVDESALSTENPSDAYEYMGPFIYEVTTHREILEFDSDKGEIKYSEYETFEWCENCTWNGTFNGIERAHASVSGDTEITQLNILWNTQRMAGISTGITYGETFAKAGFANEMIKFELMNKAPSIWASHDIAEMAAASSPSEVISGWFSAIGATPPDWANESDISGVPDSIIGTLGEANLLGQRAMTNGIIDSSTGTCISLSCEIGPLVFAGMGAPSDTVTPVRASLYGYSDSEFMAAIDAAVYAGAATAFASNGGGVSIENITNFRDRVKEVTKSSNCRDVDFGESNYNPGSYCDSSADIPNPAALDYTLFGINEETGVAAGILATTDLDGIPIHGTALLLLGASSDTKGALEEYLIGLELLDLVNYVGKLMSQGHLSSLIGDTTQIPNIIFGGTGSINADTWWEASFGGTEPLTGGYLSIGLNRGAYEGTVQMTAEKSREVLYDSPFALTGDFARIFIYGELSGVSLPMASDGSFEAGGAEVPWDDSYVAGLYGISESEAAALRSWVKDFMFESVIGALLTFQYGSGEFTTQPISNWLYGWSDPVLVGLYGYDNSWSSLETNQTYYGSGGLSTGDYSVYVMSTKGDTIGQSVMEGYINSDGETCSYKMGAEGWEKDVKCDAGEVYALTPSMPWRSEYSEEFSYGLLSDHVGNTNTETAGTIGGKSAPLVNDPSSPFRLNVVGYAIGESEVVGDVTFKGIDMVEHSLVLEPQEHQIQAKLIGSKTFVDVLPGALPVYFSTESTFRVDKVAGAVMYGDVTATFHLDLRGPGSIDPDFSDESIDTHPVFVIKSFSEIDDQGASDYRASVTDNMGMMGWTNFGGDAGAPLLYVHLVIALLYVASIGMISFGFYENSTKGDEGDESEE